MKNILILILLLILNSNLFGQYVYIKLLNQSNENKTRIIKGKSTTEISIDYQTKVDTINNVRTVISTFGNLTEVCKDSIKLFTTDYNTYLFYPDSSVNITDTITICKKDICRIGVSKSGGNPFSTISVSGIVSALIVAPLISIDYKNGEINGDQYFRVAGISTVVSIICLPLLSTVNKHYWIINKAKSKKRLWRIE
ncbi:MAG: hypothetical protein HY951_07750 [Bacteroidia bacterium]|nr:hypothetical protein [Bacteroidia bacterium]